VYVTQGLQRAAQIKPNGTATAFRNRRRTWRETEDRVAHLAGGLLKLGLSIGSRVAILALNSDRYLEYLLAVPNAGCAVVPINIRLAAPEIAYILEDSGAEVLFIDDRFAPMLKGLEGKIGSLREVVFLGDGTPPSGMCAYEDLISAPRIEEPIAQTTILPAFSIPAAPRARPRA
jgi:long-chain acyl-CoA synthetase